HDVRLINLLEPMKVTRVVAAHRIEGLRLGTRNRYLFAVGDTWLTVWELPGLRNVARIDLGGPLPAPPPCGLLDAVCRRAAAEPWSRAVEPLFVSQDEGFIAWNVEGRLEVWTLPDGVLRYSSSQPGVVRALLENEGTLLLGQSDGRVKVLDTKSWQS